MTQLVKKENMVIVIREYTDNQGQAKKVYKTIGELITWQGDDGSHYQSFETWGPNGVMPGKVFSQDNNNQATPQPQHQQPQYVPNQQHPQHGGQPAYGSQRG